MSYDHGTAYKFEFGNVAAEKIKAELERLLAESDVKCSHSQHNKFVNMIDKS